MGYPTCQNKCDGESIFTPDDYRAYLKERGKYPKTPPPDGVILCYHGNLMKYILENHKTTKVEIFGEMYLLDETDGKVAVIGDFGIGAPAAVATLEDLIAFGVGNFISIGVAGTLQKDIPIGSLVVCDRAIRDEGTSHHYLKRSKYAHASEEITRKMVSSLEERKLKHFFGASWTIDAPYRETVAEAKQYQEEGVATVEMEASALFAVAQYRNVQLGAVFVISDSLAELEWKPRFHLKNTRKGLETLYKVAIDVLHER